MTETVQITRKQARRFLLRRHGLLGGYQFAGKQGVVDFIRRMGCLQYDPVDVCGKNAELVLLSRVKGFKKEMLAQLLYEDRALVDYFDKNLAIFPVEDWPCFECSRREHRQWERSHQEIEAVRDQIRVEIARRGPLSSADLDMAEKVHWYWSDTRLSRAALEHMYFTGELGIHHKRGSIKYYDLIERCLPAEILSSPDPNADAHDHRKWRVLRRIRSIGFLWNRPSDAWLNIPGINRAERERIFPELLAEGKITAFRVEDIGEPLYMCKREWESRGEWMQDRAWKKRCEFIAPLDNLMWDRKLIEAVFGFSYKWEIYTPREKRKYGHYVLPILYGGSFAGRIEAVADRKRGILDVRNIWYEPGFRQSAGFEAALKDAEGRLAAFNCLQLPSE